MHALIRQQRRRSSQSVRTHSIYIHVHVLIGYNIYTHNIGRVHSETRVRFSDWTPCHESCPSAARSRVKARQTRISSLIASQDPHVGYVCGTLRYL